MSEEEKVEILKNKFLKYHLEYKDEEMLFEIIEKLQKENKNAMILIEQYSNEREKILKREGELISKDIIRDKIKKAEKNYESCSKGNVVEKAYYKNKIDTLKELLGG